MEKHESLSGKNRWLLCSGQSSMERTRNPTAKRVMLQFEVSNIVVVLPCTSPLRYMTDLVGADSAVTLFAHFCSSLLLFTRAAVCCRRRFATLHKLPNSTLFPDTAPQSTKQHCCINHLTAATMASTHTTEEAQKTCPRCTEPATKFCST